METIAKIRRRHIVGKESLSSIARDLNLSRNTVRKYITATAEPIYQRKHQPTPKLGHHQPLLETWLKFDHKLPRSQRRTAQRLFEGLQVEGYQGAYDSVQRFVKQWKSTHIKPTNKKAFIPMTFAAGDACQFDWSLEHVDLGGVATTLKVAHFRMAYSRKPFVVAYPNETQEMLFDAHNRAFSYFGGVPKRMLYDNLKAVVQEVGVGKERLFNSRFMAMASHYLFEPVACTPAAGWEKGQVENQVGNIREWLFTPRPKFDNLTELNDWLYQRCEALANRKHPVRDETIATVFKEEQCLLQPITAQFDGYIEQLQRVSHTCLVTVERNRYSVPSAYAGQIVSVRRTAQQIRIAVNHQEVASHPRDFGRNHLSFDLWHYLPILAQKPGALRDGAPFKELPEAILLVKDFLLKQPKGDRAFVELLMLTKEHGLEPLQVACELAIGYGVYTAAIVMNELRRLVSPPKPQTLTLPNLLQLKHEPIANCGRYDQLREVSHAC